MSDDKNKVTNGDSFGATFKGAEDDGSTSFEGDVELGKIGFCGWSDNKKTWLILKLLFLGFTVQMMLVGFDEVLPLWMLSTPEVGGLGWNTNKVGKLVLTTGILMGMLQFTVLPLMVRLVGIVRWYRMGWVMAVVILVLIPNVKNLSWNSPSLFAVGVMGSLIFYLCASALSGLYNTVENLGCFFGPMSFSTIYALSISCSTRGGEAEDGSRVSWLDHRFVFYASAGVFALLAGVGWCTLTSEILDKPVTEEVE